MARILFGHSKQSEQRKLSKVVNTTLAVQETQSPWLGKKLSQTSTRLTFKSMSFIIFLQSCALFLLL